jgi:hypothetical protein
MKKVVIIFPSNRHLCDFVIETAVSKAEASSQEKTLIAELKENEIIQAVKEYGGHLNTEWSGYPPPANISFV